MRIVFFGTGKFGIATLKRLIKSDHEISAVVTQPDRKVGRGLRIQPAPIKVTLESLMQDAKVLQPEKLTNDFMDTVKGLKADIFVVVDYGKILPVAMLDIPKKYCINLHPSLLPKYRGSSPINRVIINGDVVTGNTVIRMNERMDAGDIILREQMRIENAEDSVSLASRLSVNGAELVIKALDMIAKGNENFAEQDEEEATYSPKLKKSDGEIEWALTGKEIERKIRGLKPWPGVYTYLNGRMLKIIEVDRTVPLGGKGAEGTVMVSDKEIFVQTSDDMLRIKTLQFEGRKAMSAEEFLRGNPIKEGTVLGKAQ